MNSRGCFNNHLLQYCYHITSRQVANTKRSHFRGYIVLTHGSIYILRFFLGQFCRGSKVGLFENGFIIIFPKWPYMGVLLCIPFSDIPKVLRIFISKSGSFFERPYTWEWNSHARPDSSALFINLTPKIIWRANTPSPPQYIIPNTSHKPFFGGFKLIWNRQWGLFSVRGMGLFYLVLRANHSKVVRALLTCLEVADDSLSFCERDGWRAVSVAAAWWGGWWVGLWFKFKR